MTRAQSPTPEISFDLSAIEHEMRDEVAYGRDGHTARTLVREADLRVVLIVMKAGAAVKEHRAADTATIHVLTGHARVLLSDRVIDLPGGRLLVLERYAPHSVDAVADSTFLLTLGWGPKS